MNSEDIKYPKVESYCNEIHHLGQQLKSKFDDVNGVATTLINKEHWVSPASETYGKELKNVVSQFDRIHKELENCVLYMAKVSDSYQKLDKNLINGIFSILGTTDHTSDVFPNISEGE